MPPDAITPEHRFAAFGLTLPGFARQGWSGPADSTMKPEHWPGKGA